MTSALLFGQIRVMLFAGMLLAAQGMMLLHELEHGLAGESEVCAICLHASHDGNALPGATINPLLPYSRIFHRHILPSVQLAISHYIPGARAPPFIFPG